MFLPFPFPSPCTPNLILFLRAGGGLFGGEQEKDLLLGSILQRITGTYGMFSPTTDHYACLYGAAYRVRNDLLRWNPQLALAIPNS